MVKRSTEGIESGNVNAVIGFMAHSKSLLQAKAGRYLGLSRNVGISAGSTVLSKERGQLRAEWADRHQASGAS